MEGSDAGSGAFGGWDRAANAFACFAFDTARANGAGVGEALGCMLTPGALSDSPSLEYTEDVVLLARDPRSIERRRTLELDLFDAAIASNFWA
jgi:hypothetical protein